MPAGRFLIPAIIAILSLLTGQLALMGQIIDQDSSSTLIKSAPKDTASLKKPGFFSGIFKPYYPNPKKAAFLSFVIPGGGQIYNQRYWKLGIWYPLYGALGYSIHFNGGEYRRYKKAVEQRLAGTPDEFPTLSINGLRAYRDLYQKRTELSYVGISLTHLLQTLDAYVDAHLKTFKIEEDLGMQIRPTVVPGPQGYPLPALGLRMQISK